MKTCFVILCAVLSLVPSFAADTPTDLSLTDGSRIKGRVMSATATEVTVMSDLGVLRIALDKLTPESRAKVLEGAKPDVDALLRKISELEAKVSQLQQENEQLRRQALTRVSPPTTTTGGQGIVTPPQTTSSGLSYTISSTGKRHNSRCRYFGSGRPCGSTDGIACKICGG